MSVNRRFSIMPSWKDEHWPRGSRQVLCLVPAQTLKGMTPPGNPNRIGHAEVLSTFRKTKEASVIIVLDEDEMHCCYKADDSGAHRL
jgi:hypothetical protein